MTSIGLISKHLLGKSTILYQHMAHGEIIFALCQEYTRILVYDI